MTKGTAPAVSVASKLDAKANFKAKVDELERAVKKGSLDMCPGHSKAAFIAWSDPARGLRPLSSSTFYDEDDEDYVLYRASATRLLKELEAARSGPKPEGRNTELARLRKEVDELKERSQKYLDQYTAVSVQLEENDKRIESLELQVARQARELKTVVPLKASK